MVIYKINTSTPATKIEQVTRWNHNYIVTSLIRRQDSIAVGDAISSVSMLHIDGDKLKTIARDYEPLGPIALEMTTQRDIVGATVRFYLSD